MIGMLTSLLLHERDRAWADYPDSITSLLARNVPALHDFAARHADNDDVQGVLVQNLTMLCLHDRECEDAVVRAGTPAFAVALLRKLRGVNIGVGTRVLELIRNMYALPGLNAFSVLAL